MLREALEYVITPAPSWARRSGLLHDIIALQARYRRHKRAWRPHLDNTKSTILAAAETCRQTRTALILGSGALYDIPLAALCDRFERVVLVDAVHPWRARRIAMGRPGVEFVHHDLSGVYEGLLMGVANGADTPPAPMTAPIPDILEEHVDLVVSANLMSQLPLAPIDFLQKHVSLDPDDEAKLARAILDAHLADIAGYDATLCLITDRRRETIGRDGEIVRASDALHDLKLPPPDHEWVWTIAPYGELSRDESVRNHVQAIITPQP
jgi:hypothetical protein